MRLDRESSRFEPFDASANVLRRGDGAQLSLRGVLDGGNSPAPSAACSSMAFHTPHERPSGEIRRSQVVTTYGAGAMVDLTEKSVLVLGTDHWCYGQAEALAVIQEPRLCRVLSPRMRQLGVELNPRAPFRAPPTTTTDVPSRAQGISVREFPEWFVCMNPDCRALFKPHTRPKSGPLEHDACQPAKGKPYKCVPVRFVATCRKGHLEEFPWAYFVHEGRACSMNKLSLREGVSGSLGDIRVECACKASRSLADALVEARNPECRGGRPWLGTQAHEPCDHRLRLLVRTATNTYFSHCESALSIPESENDLQRAVEGVRDLIGTATAQTLPIFRQIPAVRSALQAYSNADVLGALRKSTAGETEAPEGLRTAEYRQFLAAPADKGEVPQRAEAFFARRHVPPRDQPLPPQIERVVLARQLREVRVQLGFTRSEPVSPDLEGEYDLGVQLARVGLNDDWLPASEIHGEGLFVRLDDAALIRWEQRPAVQRREEELRAGHLASLQGNETALAFPGIRFYLLHSLSHLLITAMSLECGYGASAIRERIYCAGAGAPLPMAGILLSTGTPGSEGTLGGLVEQGGALLTHLRRAFDAAELCANDPLCADHSPRGDHAERFLEGAACHGCLYIAEPSCERFNRYLDRALVVPTLGKPELAFFEERP